MCLADAPRHLVDGGREAAWLRITGRCAEVVQQPGLNWQQQLWVVSGVWIAGWPIADAV